MAGVKVTVTFAAGGVACGAYFFFMFTSGGSGLWDNDWHDAKAIFNYHSGRWEMGFPKLLYRDGHDGKIIPFTEIIRIQF